MRSSHCRGKLNLTGWRAGSWTTRTWRVPRVSKIAIMIALIPHRTVDPAHEVCGKRGVTPWQGLRTQIYRWDDERRNGTLRGGSGGRSDLVTKKGFAGVVCQTWKLVHQKRNDSDTLISDLAIPTIMATQTWNVDRSSTADRWVDATQFSDMRHRCTVYSMC